jgi:hypothetical protein
MRAQLVQPLRPPQEPELQAPVRLSAAKSARRALAQPAEAKAAALSLVFPSRELARAAEKPAVQERSPALPLAEQE